MKMVALLMQININNTSIECEINSYVRNKDFSI